MEHQFTAAIKETLKKHFSGASDDLFEKSQLLQYINLKTKSAARESKARGSFANLYAVYVLMEDYVNKGFDKKAGYSRYEGAEFNKLLQRQRELPFGAKLQNHALNHRMNSEFEKFFPSSEYTPILRNLETNRYWINESLIKVRVGRKKYNLSRAILEVIEQYAQVKKLALEQFISSCLTLKKIKRNKTNEIEGFVLNLLEPNADARLFEIVSYAILKYHYNDQKIYWGFDIDKIREENLKLYKTGRTNANDGGIDFVMKPLGRFFQVTETLDVKKYFLDIDKIHRYPITFVVKSLNNEEEILKRIESNALRVYSIKSVVDKYMESIEEVVNIPKLRKCFKRVIEDGHAKNLLDEIILQSKTEFNYQED